MKLDLRHGAGLGLLAIGIGLGGGDPASAALRPAGEGVSRLFCAENEADTPPRTVVLRKEIETDYLDGLNRIGLFATVEPDLAKPVGRRGKMKVTTTVMPLFGPALLLDRIRGRQDSDDGFTEAARVVDGRISTGAIVQWSFRLTKYEPFDGCVEVFAAVFDPALLEN